MTGQDSIGNVEDTAVGPERCQGRRSSWRFWRISLYLAYAIFGVLHALSWNLPLFAWEIHFSHQRMFETWNDFSWSGLAHIPYRTVEMGAIPLYIFASPFFWFLGLCLASVQLAVVVSNLIGLMLIERALPSRAEGLLAAALAGLGLSHVTYYQMAPNGGHNDMLLPFGLLLYLASRFLRSAAALSRSTALLYGLAVSGIVVFMPSLGIVAVIACSVCLLTLRGPVLKRVAPFLALGVLIGLALCAPLVMMQSEPAGTFQFLRQEIVQYPRRAAWLVAQDLATYLSIRGLAVTGYALEFTLIGLFVWGVRSGAVRKDSLFKIVLLSSFVMPLWIAIYPTHIPDRPFADYFRLRYLSMCWPIWAVLFATGGMRLWGASATTLLEKTVRRTPLALAGFWIVSGTALSYGTVDYCHLGVTRQMPLATPAGRILSEERYRFPGDLESLLVAPPGIRETRAMFFPYWFMIMGREAQTISWFEQLPADLKEPYAFGAGFIPCEGTIPVLPEAQAVLVSLQEKMSPAERETMASGCEMAHRLRDGTLEFHALAWPIEERVINLSSCQLIRGWERFGTLPVGTKRTRWPFVGE